MISANANVHISGKLLVLTVRKTDTDISGGIAWGLGEAGGRLAMRGGGVCVHYFGQGISLPDRIWM